MDRHWLLTWTTYGTWLPGDARGSTIRVPDTAGKRTFRQIAGDSRRSRALAESARRSLKQPAVRLSREQAGIVLAQIRAQASFRAWDLAACAVMANHVHAVVGVGPDEDPSRLLNAFKAYGSRELNERYPRPPSGTWWTQSGSTRRLRAESNVIAAVRYVRDQPYALAVWLRVNP